MTKQIISAIKIIALATILSFGLSYVYAWTAPTATPPSGNVSAPVNTGDKTQYKAGNLVLNNGVAPFAIGLVVLNGNVGIGTASPTQTLSVNGVIESTSGGFKFPDGTTLVSAPASGLGYGQTWQNLSASRLTNTNYTNDTSKPIIVSVNSGMYGLSGSTSRITVDGVVASQCTVTALTSNCAVNAVVPPGSTYSVYLSYIYNQAGTSGMNWAELR